MSQNIDDSPVSDNKMDISEPTTISQESLGLSPETEQKSHSIAASDSMSILSNDATSKSNASLMNSLVAATTKATTTTTNADSKLTNLHTSNGYLSGSDQHDNKYDDSSLDNRSIINNKNTITNSKQRIGMTLVDMHPLMAPPLNSDDDMSPDSPTQLNGAYNFQEFQIKNELPVFESPKRLAADTKQNLTTKSYISSDESEPDLSQYQALVEPTFKSVSLTNQSFQTVTTGITTVNAVPKANRTLRKIPLTAELMVTREDDSSVETFSNNSFDDDCEGEDGDDDDEIGFKEANTLKSNNLQSLGGEAGIVTMNNSTDDQHMVVITLADGQTRDIDMKVIEPYKRCLSHGGYLKSGGNNAIVIFSACYLPDRSRTDYHYVMENLFLYVIKTLEQFVTEDYILIYLHGGSNRNTVPPLPWLKKCYHLLDRRIRKSLKNLYMVHPTFWLKSVVWMARPFISSKFWRKLVYIRTLDDLYNRVPVEKAAVPEKVKSYDMKHS